MNKPQRIFITGASDGIGAGLARYYAGAGSTLGLVARRSELLHTLADELHCSGTVVHVYVQDVADTDGMAMIIKDYLDRTGGIDLVFANAGVALGSGALLICDDDTCVVDLAKSLMNFKK